MGVHMFTTGSPLFNVQVYLLPVQFRPHPHWKQHATRDARRQEMGPVLFVCSVYSPVATTGFARPNLLRFSRCVQCRQGMALACLRPYPHWMQCEKRSKLGRANPVVATGFARPNLHRVLLGVQCG